MAQHQFTSHSERCLCRWCGRDYGPCLVPDDMRAVLKKFAAEHGRTWKSQLRHIWTIGADHNSPILRQCRNVIGPAGLYRISAAMLATVEHRGQLDY